MTSALELVRLPSSVPHSTENEHTTPFHQTNLLLTQIPHPDMALCSAVAELTHRHKDIFVSEN